MDKKRKPSDHTKKHSKHCHKNGHSSSASKRHLADINDKHSKKSSEHKKEEHYQTNHQHSERHSKKEHNHISRENRQAESKKHDRSESSRPFRENGRLDARDTTMTKEKTSSNESKQSKSTDKHDARKSRKTDSKEKSATRDGKKLSSSLHRGRQNEDKSLHQEKVLSSPEEKPRENRRLVPDERFSGEDRRHRDKSVEKSRENEKTFEKSRDNGKAAEKSRENGKGEKRKQSSRRQDEKNRKTEEDDSYEELSRKKKKIESELHALDLEEAAEAEKKKKSDRKPSSVSQKPFKKKETVVVKQEPISDSSPEERKKDKRKADRPSKPDKDKHQTKMPKQQPKAEEWGKEEHKRSADPKENKAKPNFEVSGKLAEDTNVYNGVVIKYNEPAEAKKPMKRWRLYPFKGDSTLPFIPIHRQSAYLFGRTRSIADIPIDHPSCSKQHAVLQFRLVPYTRDDGTKGRRVRPYIIDLESSNGTFVNNNRIESRRYMELIEKDLIKFGFSSREYVILHEECKTDEIVEDEGVGSEEDP